MDGDWRPGEVVSARSFAELLDPASLGLLITGQGHPGSGGQFQANSHWPLREDASAVPASSAWVATSWVAWVCEMQVGDSPSPLLVSGSRQSFEDNLRILANFGKFSHKN